MTLTSGTRLGVYEILSLVGAGGMGEVYRARDSRLDRIVAIKILSSADPELQARFQREAKAVAALSHPGIVAIFDFGSAYGIAYAVTELLQGETLRRRLEDGPLPAAKATDCAIQIAIENDRHNSQSCASHSRCSVAAGNRRALGNATSIGVE